MTPPMPTSAYDIAKKITCHFETHYSIGPKNWYSQCEPYLARQIELAQKEAYEKGVKETLGIQTSVAEMEQEAYEKGFAEGIEEAARECAESESFEGRELAIRIRSLRPGGEK